MGRHSYDLVIVGAGSGNMLPAKEFTGWRIAVAESDRFGGTCLNRGCNPSKMLVHTADVAGGGGVHLDQVLLAGQSMPVPQQHQDLHAAEGAEGVGLPFRCGDERHAAHVNCRRLRCWH